MNTTTAVFKTGARRTTAGALTQYDVGQILVIHGLELPDIFEAHFSNHQFEGNSKPWIGRDDQVEIPDEYLESGEPIYVTIYMHYGEHDGKTEYWITIPVDRNTRPTNFKPRFNELDVISQTIAAVQFAAAKAEENANTAEAAKEAIINLGVDLEDVGPDVPASIQKIVDEETGEVTLKFGLRQGHKGDKGDKGAIYRPTVDDSGMLTWTLTDTPEDPVEFNIVEAVLAELPHAEEAWF